jgi:hypothetical protein
MFFWDLWVFFIKKVHIALIVSQIQCSTHSLSFPHFFMYIPMNIRSTIRQMLWHACFLISLQSGRECSEAGHYITVTAQFPHSADN